MALFASRKKQHKLNQGFKGLSLGLFWKNFISKAWIIVLIVSALMGVAINFSDSHTPQVRAQNTETDDSVQDDTESGSDDISSAGSGAEPVNTRESQGDATNQERGEETESTTSSGPSNGDTSSDRETVGATQRPAESSGLGENDPCQTNKIDYTNLFILSKNIPIIPEGCGEDPGDGGPRPISPGLFGDIALRIYAFAISLAFNTLGFVLAMIALKGMIDNLFGSEGTAMDKFLKERLPKMVWGMGLIIFAYIVPITVFGVFNISVVVDFECLFTTGDNNNCDPVETETQEVEESERPDPFGENDSSGNTNGNTSSSSNTENSSNSTTNTSDRDSTGGLQTNPVEE